MDHRPAQSPRTYVAPELAIVTEGSHISVSGELDMATAQALDRALASHSGCGTPLLLDLSRVTFVDLSGLQPIVECARARSSMGATTEIVPSRQVDRLLRILERIGLPLGVSVLPPPESEPVPRTPTQGRAPS